MSHGLSASRRRFRLGRLVAGALLSGSIGAVAVSSPNVAAQASSPNFVVIVADDMNLNDFTREVMPNTFRYIVDRGVTFNNYISTSPLCGPVRATLLSGDFAHNHGVKFCNDVAGNLQKYDSYQKNGYADNDTGTFFQSRGYFTSMVGKYLNSYGTPGVMRRAFDVTGTAAYDNYVPMGWNDFFVPTGTTYYDYEVIDNGVRTQYGAADKDYRTDVEVKQALASIKAAAVAKKPFFLDLWHYGPHQSTATTRQTEPAPRHERFAAGALFPRTPDVNEADMSDKSSVIQLGITPPASMAVFDSLYQRRLGSLQSIDEGIGEIVSYLKMTNQFDNTYFVFLSDNGFSMANHRLSGKMNPYDTAVHMPMSIAGPGIVTKQVRNEVVAAVDVFPTLYELATGSVPRVDGQSFVRLLRSNPPLSGWRSSTLVEHWATATGQVALDGPRVSVLMEYQMLRFGSEVYLKWYTGETEYYNLATDPYQLTNTVSLLTPDQLQALNTKLAAMASCKREACWDYAGQNPTNLVSLTRSNAPGAGIKHPILPIKLAANPVIAVTAPLPNAKLSRSGSIAFTWSNAGMPQSDTVSIWLESQRQSPVIITRSAPNSGTFSLRLPSTTALGKYRLVIHSNTDPSWTNLARSVELVR